MYRLLKRRELFMIRNDSRHILCALPSSAGYVIQYLSFFLLGIYGVLTTTDNADKRDTMLTKLIATAVRGLEVR